MIISALWLDGAVGANAGFRGCMLAVLVACVFPRQLTKRDWSSILRRRHDQRESSFLAVSKPSQRGANAANGGIGQTREIDLEIVERLHREIARDSVTAFFIGSKHRLLERIPCCEDLAIQRIHLHR